MEKETKEKTVQEMFEEMYELAEKIRKHDEQPHKENMQKAVNPKHTVPFGNGSQQEQDEMEELSKTNPALYAAITSWN